MEKMTGGINYIGKSTEQKPTDGVKPGEKMYLVDTNQIFIFCDSQWWTIPAGGGGGTSEKTYDKFVVVCVAGQSNAVGYDESPVDLNFTYKNRDPKRIKQLGYYDADNLQLIELGHCAQNLQDMRTKPNGQPIQDVNGVRGTKGIHLPLANLMLDHIPEDYGVLVVPVAYGSTGLTSGNEGSYNQDTKKPDAIANGLKWSPTSALYQTMKGRIIHALELNSENLFAGVIWCQGENDKSSASGHKTAFEEMTTAFFADMNAHDGGSLRSRVPKGEWDKDIWYNLETVTYWDFQGQCKDIWKNYKEWNGKTYIDIPRDTDSNAIGGTGATSSAHASHYGNNSYYKVIAPRTLQKMIDMDTFSKKLEAVDVSEVYDSDIPADKIVTDADVSISKVSDAFSITVADGECTISQDVTAQLFQAEKPLVYFGDVYKLEWKATRSIYWLMIEGTDVNNCILVGIGGDYSHRIARISGGSATVILDSIKVYPDDNYTLQTNDRIRVYRNKDKTVSVYRTNNGNGIFQKWFDCEITNFHKASGLGITFGITSGEVLAPFDADKTTIFSELSFQKKEYEISNKLFDLVVNDLERRIAALESPTT